MAPAHACYEGHTVSAAVLPGLLKHCSIAVMHKGLPQSISEGS